MSALWFNVALLPSNADHTLERANYSHSQLRMFAQRGGGGSMSKFYTMLLKAF